MYTYVGNNPVNYIDPTGHGPTLAGPGVLPKMDLLGGIAGWYSLIDEWYSSLAGESLSDTFYNLSVGLGPEGPAAFKALEDAGRYLSWLGKLSGSAEVSAEAKTATSAVQLGKQGEKMLVDTIGNGGQTQVFFKTSVGARYVDYLKDGVAYESKNGFVKMSSDFMKQASKDAELLSSKQVDKVVWHFWKGADKSVLDYLADQGIEWVVH